MLKLTALFTVFLTSLAQAQEVKSLYSKIDFETSCVWEKPLSEEEAQMGGSAICQGLAIGSNHWPIYFAEGDLRQFVGFGHVADLKAFVGGFAQWNSVNTTVEWRVKNGKPYATILRWFLDNIDHDTGSAEKNLRGNVLVISKVAHHAGLGGRGLSCPIGYVDAKANKNANLLAREIADEYGETFKCGINQPQFYGNRGEHSGDPNDLVESQRRY